MRDCCPGLLHKVFLPIGLSAVLGFASCAPADEKGFQDAFGLAGRGASAQSAVEFTATLVSEGKPGEVTLRLSAVIPPENWIYSTTPGQGPETKITIKAARGLEEIDAKFEADHSPEIVEDPNLERTVEKYFKKVIWTRRYRINAGVSAESASVAGLVRYQVCDKHSCRLGKYEFDAKLASAPVPAGGSRAAVPQNESTRFEQRVGKEKSVEGTWTVSLSPKQARPGDDVTITVEANLNPGWHVYALDQRQLPDGSGPSATVIGLSEQVPLLAVTPAFVGPNPIDEPSEWEGLNQRYHEGRIQWIRKFHIPADTANGSIALAGKVAWTMCNSRKCEPATGFEFRGMLVVSNEVLPDAVPLFVTSKLDVATAGQALDELRLNAAQSTPPEAVSAPTSDAVRSAPLPARGPQGVAPGRPGSAIEVVDQPAAGGIDTSKGLFFFLTTAVVFGFGALLTPCVFPMIPITVSFFQKQSEKEHHRPVTMALVYCLGIIGTFTGLGMVMSIIFTAGSIAQLANSILLNLFISGVLIFFAFNLLGMFEIRVPSWLLTYTAGQEGRGGFIGVLFMALTFTLTSFTCTFAFAGGLLVAAQNGARLWPILGLLAFSTAFSLPFFFLALFPSFLKRLPKSGGWMNVAKVIMGLIELGAAIKFLGNADQRWNGQPAVIDFHLMIAIWAVISVAAALYLFGLFRLPHDVPTDHIGVFRFMWAMSFLGFAIYLGVGLFGAEKPQGAIWKNVEALANSTFDVGTDRIGPYRKHGNLKYALDFERALEVAIAENKPLFLDFTGVNCANCRAMEKGPMSQPAIEKRLGQFVLTQLFTDSVPIKDAAERERLLKFNIRLQEGWFGTVSLPSYAVIPPDRSALKPPGQMLSKLEGYNDEAAFAQFLDEGLNKWKKIQASRAGRDVGQR
jgi:thiol:disulfide interchange protein DsbD